jgi:hypothetical protein
MAKKGRPAVRAARAEAPATAAPVVGKPESLQSVANAILDAEGTLSGGALVAKVQAIRPDAKEGSIKQALSIWKKRKGFTKSRTVKKAKPQTSGGRIKAGSNLMETLRRVSALAAVIDLPEDKLPEIIKALS